MFESSRSRLLLKNAAIKDKKKNILADMKIFITEHFLLSPEARYNDDGGDIAGTFFFFSFSAFKEVNWDFMLIRLDVQNS